MNEDDVVEDHMNQLELIAKELADVGHTLSEKMQVTVVLNRVYMGNNTYSDVFGEGRCKFSISDSVIVLNNVLYVPSVHRNLIFVPMLDEKGFEIKIKSSRVFISKGNISVSGVKVDGMYLLKCDINKDFISDYLNVSNALNKQKMMRMSKSGLIPQINLDDC